MGGKDRLKQHLDEIIVVRTRNCSSVEDGSV